MRAFNLILLAAWVFAELSLAEKPYTIWDHGRDCAAALGVEVPRFNCLDGAEIPVTVNGVRKRPGDRVPACDKNADGSSGCHPGSRLLKFVDSIVRDGRRERVVTTIICRGGSQHKGDPNFHDVAIIQHNETNNKVCWFNQLVNQNSTNVPPPYTASVSRDRNQEAERYWGRTPTTLNCMSCHNSGLYVRTPWIMQVDGVPEGAFERTGGIGEYTKGGRNGFPNNNQAGRRGFACSIGRTHEEWNETRPKLIKINAPAFAAYRKSQGAPIPEGSASAGTCTRCHFLGAGPRGEQTICNMAKQSVGKNGRGWYASLTTKGRAFPNSHWMPPQNESEWQPNFTPSGGESERELELMSRGYEAFLRPAIEAVSFCCDGKNYDATFNGESLCKGSFGQYPGAGENPNPCEAKGDGSARPHEERGH